AIAKRDAAREEIGDAPMLQAAQRGPKKPLPLGQLADGICRDAANSIRILGIGAPLPPILIVLVAVSLFQILICEAKFPHDGESRLLSRLLCAVAVIGVYRALPHQRIALIKGIERQRI